MFRRRKDFHSFGDVCCGKGQVYIECSTYVFMPWFGPKFWQCIRFSICAKTDILDQIMVFSTLLLLSLCRERGMKQQKKLFAANEISTKKISEKPNIRNVYLLKRRNEPLVWAFVVLLYCSKLSVRPLAVFNFFKKVNQEKSSLISQESNQISWESNVGKARRAQ